MEERSIRAIHYFLGYLSPGENFLATQLRLQRLQAPVVLPAPLPFHPRTQHFAHNVPVVPLVRLGSSGSSQAAVQYVGVDETLSARARYVATLAQVLHAVVSVNDGDRDATTEQPPVVIIARYHRIVQAAPIIKRTFSGAHACADTLEIRAGSLDSILPGTRTCIL